MSSTLRATTSQPRSLLSIARLNIARSRLRSATWSLVRIDQTCFGRSGGLAPTSLPLFQGRLDAITAWVSLSCMVILLVSENDQHGLSASVPDRQSASGYWGATVVAGVKVSASFFSPQGALPGIYPPYPHLRPPSYTPPPRAETPP